MLEAASAGTTTEAIHTWTSYVAEVAGERRLDVIAEPGRSDPPRRAQGAVNLAQLALACMMRLMPSVVSPEARRKGQG